jgi:hypothetical protein
MKLVEAEMTNCHSSITLDKGLKPLAPYDPVTQGSEFREFDDSP